MIWFQEFCMGLHMTHIGCTGCTVPSARMHSTECSDAQYRVLGCTVPSVRLMMRAIQFELDESQRHDYAVGEPTEYAC